MFIVANIFQNILVNLERRNEPWFSFIIDLNYEKWKKKWKTKFSTRTNLFGVGYVFEKINWLEICCSNPTRGRKNSKFLPLAMSEQLSFTTSCGNLTPPHMLILHAPPWGPPMHAARTVVWQCYDAMVGVHLRKHKSHFHKNSCP